jgi:deoxyhypusine synthase
VHKKRPYPPTEPLEINPGDSVAEVLTKMRKISFQGRSLGEAFDIWQQMLEDDCTISLGLSGAMTAGGFRRIVAYLIEHRFIDVLVSTGANLFHDIYESLGHTHFLGDPDQDDIQLRNAHLDRVYDTLLDEDIFRVIDRWVMDWAYGRLEHRPYSSREFLYELGHTLSETAKVDGILTSAYKAGIPVYCPAIADSSFGIALAGRKDKADLPFLFNLIRDVEETAMIFEKSKDTAVIYIGGGTPKNFIQQSAVIVDKDEYKGHKYGIQITADAAHWGGLSGCTFSEAKSWGKIHPRARMATVRSDATIAFPFLVTGLAAAGAELVKKRKKPTFEQKANLVFNGLTVAALPAGLSR